MRLSLLAICATAFFNVISSEPPNAERSLPTNQYAVSSYNKRSPLHTSVAENKWNRNLHKKIFICANINWCRRRREWDARNLTFFLSRRLRLAWPNEYEACVFERKVERKWKFAPLLDIYARDNQKVVIIDSGREGEREIDAQKEIRCDWKPKSIAWHSSGFCFRNTRAIACMLRGWSRLHEVSPLACWKASKVWTAFRGLRFNDRFCIDLEAKTKVSVFERFVRGFASSKVLRIANASRQRCFQVIFHFAESFRFHSSKMPIISPDVC